MRKRTSSRGPSSPLRAPPSPLAATASPSTDDSSQSDSPGLRWAKRVAKATFVERLVLFILAHIKVVLVIFTVLLLMVFSNEVERQIPVGFVVDDPVRPGLLFNKSLIKTRLPVVFVPGFITTALELWEGDLCAVGGAWSPFRQRLISAQSFLTIIRNPSCYLRHFSLDPQHAGDPIGVKVRPDSSFSSADYLVFGFWVWAKLILNLADIGYDPNTMHIASYDWRLDAETAERRDKYFSKLRAHIEASFDGSHRYVLVGHSYGSSIIQEFLLWADKKDAGWTSVHIDSIFSIAGPFLGVPKAFGALISGEVKDTALMPSALRYLLDSHITKPERTQAFRTWPCLTALLPIGGDCLWPSVLHLTDTSAPRTLDGTHALHLLSRLMNSTGHTHNVRNVEKRIREFDSRSKLPVAPSTTVYCVYGTGLPSETAYIFKPDTPRVDFLWTVDTDSTNETWSHPLQGKGVLRSGVGLVDGDGTVPLVSLGYPCRSVRGGFRSDVGRVVTYEVPHAQSSLMDLRGGSGTADHVDIMGNYDVITALLKVVTGNGGEVHDRITSDLDKLVADVDACKG